MGCVESKERDHVRDKINQEITPKDDDNNGHAIIINSAKYLSRTSENGGSSAKTTSIPEGSSETKTSKPKDGLGTTTPKPGGSTSKPEANSRTKISKPGGSLETKTARPGGDSGTKTSGHYGGYSYTPDGNEYDTSYGHLNRGGHDTTTGGYSG